MPRCLFPVSEMPRNRVHWLTTLAACALAPTIYVSPNYNNDHRAKKAELASSYLEWTSDPIHKSLTDVSGLKGEAKKQFKNLLGYCGDRKYQYPDPLIRDIVAKGE